MTVGKIALTNNNKTADNRLIARFSAVFTLLLRFFCGGKSIA